MHTFSQCCGWLTSAVQRMFPARKPRATRAESPGLTRPVFRPSNPPDEMDPLVAKLLEEHRYALLLRPQIVESLNERQFAAAYEAFTEAMALTPEGPVVVEGWRDADETDDSGRLVRVETFYIDRYAVTNAQYYQFVRAGGYEDMALWDPEILPGVLEFVDRTGEPGPRFWENGTYPPGKANHPVVGVCWYEAAAYARWVGKRLPTDPEWVKAASWPIPAADARPIQRRFPWGDSPDPSRANLWATGIGDTAPVDAFPESASVGQVYQLVGNVWEWMANPFGAWGNAPQSLDVPRSLKSIRGGAFDTYFAHHASCQFQSGDSPLARKHNVGFRCAISEHSLCLTWGAKSNQSPSSATAAASLAEATAANVSFLETSP